MFRPTTDLTSFILEQEHRLTNATGSLTVLLTQISFASKIIGSHIRKAGLVDILGQTGETNAYMEAVQKIDAFSNEVMIDILSATGQVSMLGSEELDEPIHLQKGRGRYSVFFDPLDGSSNMDTGMPVGTIFSIYHHDKGELQIGARQVASGYVLYGPTDMFIYSCGEGVHGFTLDPGIGSFLLSHPTIVIPHHGTVYSINEGNYNLWDKQTKKYIDYIKLVDKASKRPYKARYCGSMTADIHRILLKGGIFLYPADTNSPSGKLRLLYEVNPLSFLIQQAGGKAVSKGKDPLSFVPLTFDQRVPIALGSKDNIDEYLSITAK